MIERIQEYLQQEIQGLPPGPQSDERRQELERLQVVYRFLPQREYGRDEVIIPSMLLELELNGMNAYYFVAPQGGGLVTTIDGKPVQVITPNSPLGEALLGKKWGETIEVAIRGGTRRYKIVAFS